MLPENTRPDERGEGDPSRLVPWSTLFSSRKYLTPPEAGYLLGHGGEVGVVRGAEGIVQALGSASGAGLHERCASSWGQARVGPWKARVPAAASSPRGLCLWVDIPG